MLYRALAYSRFIALLVFLNGCGGGGGGGGGGGDGGSGGGVPPNSIPVTGTFTGGANAGLFQRILASLFRPAYALNASAVTRVIAILSDGTMTSAAVTNGAFSISVPKGGPVGIIFAGTNDSFLGYLTLENGIDSLPLGKIGSNVTTIDFGILSSSGQPVRGGRNPLGSDLPLTTDEQSAIRLINSTFAAVIRIPDANGNGRIDVLEQRFFRFLIFYFLEDAGTFGNALVPAMNTPARVTAHGFNLDVRDRNPPSSVAFTGPAGSGLFNTVSANAAIGTAAPGEPVWARYYAPSEPLPPIPVAGRYQIAYGTETLNLDVPDQSTAPSDILLSVPSVTLNADGTIQRLTWFYRRGNNAAPIDPQAAILAAGIWINGNGPVCPGGTSGPNRPYESNSLSATTTEHVLRCQNIPWSTVSDIRMFYTDLYGNEHYVVWNR